MTIPGMPHGSVETHTFLRSHGIFTTTFVLAARAGFAGPALVPYDWEGVLGEGLPSPSYCA